MKQQLITYILSFSILFLVGCNSYPETPEGVIEQYVKYISTGECEKAAEFCDGNVKQSTESMIDLGCEPYKVKIDSIDCVIVDTICMCKSYQTYESMETSFHIPYRLVLINGEWKIQGMTKDLLGWWDEGEGYDMDFEDTHQSAVKLKNISLFDSLKEACEINKIDTFDITELQTNNFENMFLLDENLYNLIYLDENNYMENSFYIYSYLPNKNNYMTLITYQKNFEGDNYRVDYIDLINIDSTGRQLDKIRLSAIDNMVIYYEVISFLSNDTLKTIEKLSSIPYLDPDLDTIYITTSTFKLNGNNRIDTLEIIKDFEGRKL